jgi:hypothetical protein
MTARAAPRGGAVDLSAAVRCAAGVPWVMQSTVEGVMVDQATSTLEGFMEFCHVGGFGARVGG